MNSLVRFVCGATMAAVWAPFIALADSADERKAYPALFEAAAREFDVPADILKGVAFAETRWSHLTWASGDISACNGMPRPHGIMSLWDNDHFGHGLIESSRLIGLPVEVLKADVRHNIRGGAALLRRYYEQEVIPEGTTRREIESWRNAIAAYSGIPQSDLAQQHAVDVFTFIHRGYHRHGIEWEGQQIRLEPMRAAIRSRRTAAAEQETGEPPSEEPSFQPAGQPDYPSAIWRPAYPGHWYTSGNGRHFVVIHDMEGYYLSTISYFQRSNTQASAHYCINGLKDNGSDAPAGEITQMVEERFYAWHARCLNTWSVGIEHEGFVDNPAPPSLALDSTNLLFGYGQPTAAFTVTSVDPDPALGGILWNVDFESFPSGSPNGAILFRAPAYSGTTSAFLDGGTNYTTVTDGFPAGQAGSRVLKSSWSFAPGMPSPWLRLTTASAPQIPNPAVILGQAVRVNLWTDRPLRVGVGIRETTNSAAAGDDGGLSGPIEFVGVAGVTNGTPYPVRAISPGNWVTVQFNLPAEPVSRFTGDGVIARDRSGTLEHLSLVPADGPGRYTVYIDDVQVVKANTVTYSLIDPPAGVGIDEITGRITWTTGEIAIPATNSIRVRISNQVFPPMAMETNVVLVTLPMPSPILRLVGGGAGEGERVCELRWNSIAGYAYRVQFKEQLGATGWSDLGGPLRADGSTAVMRETMPAGMPSRFLSCPGHRGVGGWRVRD